MVQITLRTKNRYFPPELPTRTKSVTYNCFPFTNRWLLYQRSFGTYSALKTGTVDFYPNAVNKKSGFVLRTALFASVFFLSSPLLADRFAEELIIMPGTHLARDDILFVCEKSGQTRAVSLTYTKIPPLPCEVIYHRPSEQIPDETLWRASNDEGFCEEKTNLLVADLINAGWHCLEE